MTAFGSSLWPAFAAGVLVLGTPYWLQPYAGLTLPNALLHPGLAVVALLAAWLRLRGITNGWKAALIATAVAPTVVALRVLGDGVIDPTRHNLWPFEILIAVLIGFPSAALGATIGMLIRRRAASPRADLQRGN